MTNTGRVLNAMIDYFENDTKRMNHFLKVYAFAKLIGEMEGLAETDQQILEIAAITHDIGIKNSEIKYGSSAGNYQEIEGPPEARTMLENLGFNESIIDRVCWLIAHHHTYSHMTALDHIFLIEADFIVNADEDNMSVEAIKTVYEKVFQSNTGKHYLTKIYNTI